MQGFRVQGLEFSLGFRFWYLGLGLWGFMGLNSVRINRGASHGHRCGTCEGGGFGQLLHALHWRNLLN